MSISYVDIVDAATGSHKTSKLNLPVVGDDATTVPLGSFLIPVTVPNSSTNILKYAPCALRVVDAFAIAKANGAAGDQVVVKNGSTAVTDVLDLSGADKAIVRATSIDDAAWDFAQGDAITIDPTSATDCSCQLYIVCVPQ